jgi:hypothetical protein
MRLRLEGYLCATRERGCKREDDRVEDFSFYACLPRGKGGRTVMWEINNSMSPLQYLLDEVLGYRWIY